MTQEKTSNVTVSHAYGTCGGNTGEKCEYLTLSFSPLNTPLRSRWRNNGLSADFLGEYVVTFLPKSEDIGGGLHSNIRHAVAYVANELLENAMKYHEQATDTAIRIYLELARDRITVSATNALGVEQAQAYRTFIEYLMQADPSELFFEQLEASAQEQESKRSCMGLLTMINDYGAQLGWQFHVNTVDNSEISVTTSAVLRIDQDVEAAA